MRAFRCRHPEDYEERCSEGSAAHPQRHKMTETELAPNQGDRLPSYIPSCFAHTRYGGGMTFARLNL